MPKADPKSGLPHRLSRVAEDLVASLRGVPSEDPPRLRRRPTQDLGELLSDLCARHGIGRSTPEQDLRERWSEIVGGPNASFSHPARIEKGGCLVIHVTHAVVRNELFMAREDLLAKIKALPGCSDIRRLLLTTG